MGDRCDCISDGEFFRVIGADGRDQVGYICPACGEYMIKGRPFFGKKVVEEMGIDVSTLDVLINYLPDTIECSVTGCENKGYQWHHWMPRYLSEDADKWPQSKLCIKHHREWHRLVTPMMLKRVKASGRPLT